MSEPAADRRNDEKSVKTWRDQIPLLFAGGIVSIAVAGTVAFGGRVMAGGEATAILNAQVQQLLDAVREQHREDKDQRQLLQDMTVKLGDSIRGGKHRKIARPRSGAFKAWKAASAISDGGSMRWKPTSAFCSR